MDVLSAKKEFAKDFSDRAYSYLPEELYNEIKGMLIPEEGEKEPLLWEAAKAIGTYYNEKVPDSDTIKACRDRIKEIREFQGRLAAESDRETTVVFGTSGWRGVIGDDFTILNVHKVTRAVIEMMKSGEFLKFNSCSSFEEVKRNGIVVFRDNRYMGDEFMEAAMKELASQGIRILSAGECPTGVGSALVTELCAAGSLNFTPSHNPMDYAGLKFNPGDGGAADKDLTGIIMEKAEEIMGDKGFKPATADISEMKEDINASEIFRLFIEEKSTVFNLDAIRKWLSLNKDDISIVVDNMHGASRGYIEKIIGEDICDTLTKASALEFVNTDTDYSFHGVKPEPSAENQMSVIKKLDRSKKFTLGTALDPDADRIRFCDSEMDIDMNRFAAVFYGGLLQEYRNSLGEEKFRKKISDKEFGIASSAPSSDFALEIAKQYNAPVFETGVGFKNFRKPIKQGNVLVAFEESDGITVRDHTLEKCAIAGFLSAIHIMMCSGKKLSELYKELRREFGYFYPAKTGAEVKGVSVSEWEDYKAKVLNTLKTRMFSKGDTLRIGDEDKEIREINTIDGLKLIFEDRSWILLRPSGTEPKFRYYYELASETELPDSDERLKEYKEAASGILKKAREIVDSE